MFSNVLLRMNASRGFFTGPERSGQQHPETWLASYRKLAEKATRLFTTIPEAEKERAAAIFHSIDRTRLQMNMWRERLLGELAFILGLKE